MKEQLTVRLEPEVLRKARERAHVEHQSVSAVIAQAAAESLLHAPASRDGEIVQLLEQLIGKVNRAAKRQQFETTALKELVGLFARAYFNHTPEVPSDLKETFVLSGKVRYRRYLDAVAANLQKGRSALEPVDPQQETTAPVTVSDDETTLSEGAIS